MSKGTVKVKVFRYNPDRDTYPSFKTYDVPIEEKTQLLQVLNSIYEDVDKTLAFRRFCCGYKFCNSCLMTINGKVGNACQKTLEAGDEVTVEPLEGFPVIRDLVVDYGRKVATPEGTFNMQRGVSIKKVAAE